MDHQRFILTLASGQKGICWLGAWAYCVCSLTVDSNPFIEILSLWQHDSLSQVPAAQCCLGMLQQLILVGSFWDVFLRLEGLRWATATAEKLTQQCINKGRLCQSSGSSLVSLIGSKSWCQRYCHVIYGVYQSHTALLQKDFSALMHFYCQFEWT